MSKSVILIDFDNIYYKKNFSEEKLSLDFGYLVDSIVSLDKNIKTIEIRLYDGWRSNSRPTQKANSVFAIIGQVEAELFPIIYDMKKVFGSISLVMSQYGFDYEWENTLAIKKGIHRLTIKNQEPDENKCSENSLCPLQMISKASKGEVVECPVGLCENVNFNKLERNEQKMVDAMMGSDLFEYALDSSFSTVAIVSDDMDILPSLLLASKHRENSTNLLYISKNRWNMNKYKNLFSDNNIKTLLWE